MAHDREHNQIKEKPKTRHAFIEHIFEYRTVRKRKIILSFIVTLAVMIVEFVGGYLSNSIALMSDAVHMLTHSIALIIGLAAIFIAKNPPCEHKTFGLYRMEVLASFVNGLILLGFSAFLIYESILRFFQPREVLSFQMFLIAFIGLGANVASMLILGESHKRDINIRSIFFHLISDAVSSIGIVAAAIIIFFTGWNVLDPIVSIFICLLIIYWALGVLRESAEILLEMTPVGLNIDDIREEIESAFPEVENVFHLHMWTITSDIVATSFYVKPRDKDLTIDRQDELASRIREHLYVKFNIIESTIQVTNQSESQTCAIR